MLLVGTLLPDLALDVDLNLLGEVELGDLFLALLLENAVGDELLDKAQARGQSPVQNDAGGGDPCHVDEHEAEEDEHHPGHGLVVLVGVLLDELIPHGANRENDEEDAEDAIPQAKAGVGHGEGEVGQDVVEAHCQLAFNLVVGQLEAQGLEQDDEDGHLDQHGQAACEGVESHLLIQLHHLLRETLLVVCVLLLQGLDLGLQLLHAEGGLQLLLLHREEQQADDDGDDADRKTPVTNELCQLVEQRGAAVKYRIPHTVSSQLGEEPQPTQLLATKRVDPSLRGQGRTHLDARGRT